MTSSRALRSLVDLCRENAQIHGDKFAYRFSDGQTTQATLSFADVDLAGRSIAGCLQQQRCQPGERVLLSFDAGADFVRAFFGCLYAGIVAVPLNLPFGPRRSAKLQAIARDAGARLLLSDVPMKPAFGAEAQDLETLDLPQLLERRGGLADFRGVDIPDSAPAFLQYTSGSTGRPKGVVVSHRNVLVNEAMIRDACKHDATTVFVGWLPLFHDMGLVGNLLQPAYLGIPSILMPPSAFVRRPIRWLQLISEYRATTSGGPNFAYETCVRRIPDSALDGLDLSSWRIAFNGAEPVRAETMEAFSQKFKAAGFSRRAFYPVYGLAEATLFVSAPDAGAPFRVRRVPAEDLERGEVPAQGMEPCPPAQSAEHGHASASDAGLSDHGRTRRLVACGRPRDGQIVRIVDPACEMALPERRVGEIWISGSNVAQGYWNDLELSRQVFCAHTRSGDGPFLRTGDLGFLDGGELYVTGRIKDLIIINGRNHYPHDLELTVSACHAAFAGRPSAAFALSTLAGESIVIAQEVAKTFLPHAAAEQKVAALRELKAKVRDVLARAHGVAPKHVLLLPQGALPMTTSGKLQRSLCEKLFLAGELREVGSHMQVPALQQAD